MNSKKPIWAFFISHHRFTTLIIFAIVFLGIFSAIQIPKESNPEVNVPFAIVTTPLPGASASDVEELVTDILEDKILSLNEIKKVESTSEEGLSIISVEFDAKADSDKKVDELKEKVDEAQIDLPDDSEDPVVRKVRFSDMPIFIFSLSGPFDIAQLKQLSETLKDEIERVPGVSKVDITGGQEREIQVIVDKAKLDTFNLQLIEVTRAIKESNADIPTGSIETAGMRYTLRLAGRLTNTKEVRKTPIALRGNIPVFVEDVAEVIDGYSERSSISKLSVEGNPALPSITLQVSKTTGGNIIRVIETVKEKIQEAKTSFLPEGVVIETTQDIAKYVKEDLGNLTRSGIQTVILVMILLLIFLGWREALLASIAIPLTFLITFTLLSFFGFTLNFLSLFSLLLSLGILIDSAIVMVEGMHEAITAKNATPKQAAFHALRTFQAPLTMGTLTTVFAFIPMLLSSGILGEFIKHIPITVTIVLLSSLFIAFAITTTLGTRWLKRKENYTETKKAQIIKKFKNQYKETLSKLLEGKRNKRTLAITLIVLFIASLALPATGILKINMFPSENRETFFINIERPIGTPLETTEKTTMQLETLLRQDPRIKSFAINVGSTINFDSQGPSSGGSHLAHAIVNLKEKRKGSSIDIVDEYQRKTSNIMGSKLSVTQGDSGPPGGAPVLITITGKSLDVLDNLSKKFETALEEIPSTRNVRTSTKESLGEFVISIDRAKAKLHGVSTLQLASTLRNAVSGSTATILRSEGNEMDVVVKYALDPTQSNQGKTNKARVQTIEALTISTPQGNIPLGAFTNIKLKGGRPSIQHENGKRVARVTSNVEPGTTPRQVFQELKKKTSHITAPSGYTIKFGGEAEDLEQSYNDMFRAMILAVLLIGGALVLQFRSYRQPFFIIATIPLALIGVLMGLMIVNKPLSFPAIIGVVALTGIVVNDAIILIDQINNNRKGGMTRKEAIIEAGSARLQPIVLTTITTVVGIIPITLSSNFWGPLGYSIIFGLSFASVMTLFVIPSLYLKFAEKELERA